MVEERKEKMKKIEKMQEFRFWCQKVLPAIYDDSLSYYELLCKVTSILNDLIENFGDLLDNFDEIKNLYQELHDFVMNYFATTDFQEKINNKLDSMVKDGSLAKVINEQVFKQINEKISTVEGLAGTINTDLQGYKEQVTNNFTDLSKKFDTIDQKLIDLTKKNCKIALLGKDAQYTDDPQRGYSHCCVINDSDHCIIIDFGNDDGSNLLAYLRASNIKKVDAVFITHYHNDHVNGGRVRKLLESEINTKSTIFYLPHANLDPSRYTSYIYGSVASEIKNILNGTGNKYIEPRDEGYVVQGCGFDVKLVNLSSTFFNDYYDYKYDEDMSKTSYTNYNNFSMGVMVSYMGYTFLSTADWELPAEKNMARYLPSVDVLEISHHGLNTVDDTKYCSSMRSKIYLLPAYGTGRVLASKTAVREQAYRGNQKGCCLSTVDGQTIVVYMGMQGLFVDKQNTGYVVPPAYVGRKIYVGQDANDIHEVGLYYTQNSAQAKQIPNLPVTSAGKLIVLNTNSNSNNKTSGVQIYLSMFSYLYPTVYIRVVNDDEYTWASWFRFTMEKI